MLKVWAVCDAMQIVRAWLKAQNHRLSEYAHREISEMPMRYLNEGNWQRLEARAYEKIMATPTLRADYEKAGAKYEAAMRRKTKAA
jgi:hypothetical protein